MNDNRIYFKDNPWPEGHPIKEFLWTAEIRNDDVWFNFHLESADYYSERDIEDEEDMEYESDWKAPGVWGNFHSCTLSTNSWHYGGFKVCSAKDYSEDFLNGRELQVDMYPENIDDWDDYAFHIYLLGHDAAAMHKIKFIRNTDATFNIEWSGKLALAYVGDYNFKYDFNTRITNIKAPTPRPAE